jgi:predicted DNA-binding transcriptional regulator YafY
MATNSETLSRQWLMLQWIPRHPRKITARDLVERLHAEGHEVTKRTVERDLAALSEAFPLTSDERAKPFGWSWQKDAPQFSLPVMSPLQAMVLKLARTHVQPLLPAHLLESLHPYFAQSDAALRQTWGKRGMAEWSRRVAVVQPTQPLLPPKVDEAALAVVHQALAQQHQVELRYQSRGMEKPARYRAHPLGLVYRGVVGYLVGTIGDYDDPRQFALHRIRQAHLLDEQAMQPQGFDLQAYARSGAFGFMDNGPIKLVLRMEAPAAEHLHETPLSEDQVITNDAHEGWVCISATVRDTSQLQWWLLGFGEQVEMVEPLHLRNAISAEHLLAARRYKEKVI